MARFYFELVSHNCSNFAPGTCWSSQQPLQEFWDDDIRRVKLGFQYLSFRDVPKLTTSLTISVGNVTLTRWSVTIVGVVRNGRICVCWKRVKEVIDKTRGSRKASHVVFKQVKAQVERDRKKTQARRTELLVQKIFQELFKRSTLMLRWIMREDV